MLYTGSFFQFTQIKRFSVFSNQTNIPFVSFLSPKCKQEIYLFIYYFVYMSWPKMFTHFCFCFLLFCFILELSLPTNSVWHRSTWLNQILIWETHNFFELHVYWQRDSKKQNEKGFVPTKNDVTFIYSMYIHCNVTSVKLFYLKCIE